MSSKHIKVLTKNKPLEGLTVSSSDEEDEKVTSIFFTFDEDDSSDTSGSSDTSDPSEATDDSQDEKVEVEEKFEEKRNDEKDDKEEEDEEMKYLNSLLLESSTSYKNTNKTSLLQYLFLVTDRRSLDIDAVMRKRFGGSSLQMTEGEEEGTGRRNNKKRDRTRRVLVNQMKKMTTLNKKLLFGNPKDEWPRPLSFINGGITMRKVESKSLGNQSNPLLENMFEIQWSREYQQLQKEYLQVQSTGDANQLCVFISHHPHHLEALLQLAMVFARTGQMDRATDLVRRCLYYIEQCHIEQFKPYEYPCGLDINQTENKIYFLALFRHMQISGMMGCPRVASSIGKFILSLDPTQDPVHTLLFLDHYFLSSGCHSEINSFCSDLAGTVLLQEYGWGCDNDEERLSSNDLLRRPANLNEALPNWAFSAALSGYLIEEKSNVRRLKPKSANVLSPSVAQLSPAQSAFVMACKRFPFMIAMSLSAAIVADKTKRNWKSILEHPFFDAFATEERYVLIELNAQIVLIFLFQAF